MFFNIWKKILLDVSQIFETFWGKTVIGIQKTNQMKKNQGSYQVGANLTVVLDREF